MVAQVGFSDYCGLMFVIADLLRLCVMATENDIENVPNSLVRRNVDVACILELALGLLPVDEMEVLDEVLEDVGKGIIAIFSKEKRKKESLPFKRRVQISTVF